MQCQNCGQAEAVIEIKQLDSHGNVKQVYLCAACAAEMKDLEANGFIEAVDTFNEMALDFLTLLQTNHQKQHNKELTCAKCGLTFTSFLKHNRVGCEACYQTFKSEIIPMIKRVQNSYQRHVGKVPEVYRYEHEREEELLMLREALQQAIQIENFEEAAKIRDKIRALEKRGENQNE